ITPWQCSRNVLKEVIIEDGVTSIGANMFLNCTAITTLSLPDTLTSINNSALLGCTGLKELYIPNGVTRVEQYAFFGCTGLENLYIPNSVTNIGQYAFSECTGLKRITLGCEDPEMGTGVFEGIGFYDSDGTTVLEGSADNLCGYIFTGTYDRMVKKNTNHVIFRVLGETVYRIPYADGDGSVECPGPVDVPGYTMSWPEFTLKDGTDALVDAIMTPIVYEVVIEANDGTGLKENTTATVEDDLDPEYGYEPPANKHFVGWSYSSDGDVLEMPLHITSDTTLYAIYAWDQYDVIYRVDGETVFTDTFDYGTEVTVRGTYEKTGYDVTGWSTNDAEVTDNKFTIGTHDVVFTASSSVGQFIYIVHYVDADNLTLAESFHGTADYGSTVDAPMKDIVGYTAPADVIKITMTDNEFLNMATYRYTISQYNVVYRVNGETVFTDEYDYRTEVTVRESYEETGHTVTGWSTDDVKVTDGKFVLGATDVIFDAVSTVNQYHVIYILNGETFLTDTFDYGTEVTVRKAYEETGHTVTGWSTNDIEVIDGKFVLGTFDVTFSAISTVNNYSYAVIYVDDDMKLISDPVNTTADYGSTVDAPIKDVAGYRAPTETVRICISDDESKNVVIYVYNIVVYTITFDDGTVRTEVTYTVRDTSIDEPPITGTEGRTASWEEYTLDLTDRTVKAVYKAHVKFISEGTVFFEYNIVDGEEIVLPSGTPSKETDVRYVHTFSGWDGYTDGMVADGDMTFTAVFVTTATVADDGTGLTVNVDEDSAAFTSDTMSDVVRKAENDPSVTMTASVGYAVVVFDNDTLRGLSTSEATLRLSVMDPKDMTQEVRDAVEGNVAYNISFGPNRTFGGTVTVTLPYDLPTGYDSDEVAVYYIADDGTMERISCTYSDGYVTFSTDHFSVYAVMYEGEPVKEGFPMPVLAAIAAILIILALSAVERRRSV
ncbi:MAG: leucine-rich repeat protein, partial [Candidatus Methanomethylophilaceae archaeon]